MSTTIEQATMFLNDLSVVDHAFIDKEGNVIGGSFNPSFLVGGRIDPIEKVVVDFSTVKKQLKNVIDHKQHGFDHKLWVIEGVSNCSIQSGDIVFTEYSEMINIDNDDIVIIKTPNAKLTVPRSAIKFIQTQQYSVVAEYNIEQVGSWFGTYLNSAFPELQIQCKNNINAHVYYPTNEIHYFSYAHGLKDSTSWGCQNIAHGHLSFIQAISLTDQSKADEVAAFIAKELDCTMFINKANVLSQYDNKIAIGYDSHSRGRFEANYTNTSKQKCVVLETETTIEFLVEYIASTYKPALQFANVTELYVSEGLSKGAMKLLEGV